VPSVLSCKARLRLSGKTVRRFCISSHVVVAWRVHARQQVQVSIAMSTGFFSELACDEFQQVSGQGDVVILTQVFHLKFQPLNFSAT
jgi:hypothetical protein